MESRCLLIEKIYHLYIISFRTNSQSLPTRLPICSILFIPFIILASALALPPSSNSDPGSHSGPSLAGPPSPSPLRYVPSLSSREGFRILVPRRLASNSMGPHFKSFFSTSQFPGGKRISGGDRGQHLLVRKQILD